MSIRQEDIFEVLRNSKGKVTGFRICNEKVKGLRKQTMFNLDKFENKENKDAEKTKAMTKDLSEVTEQATAKYFSGSNQFVDIAIKFNGDGIVNPLVEPMITFKSKVADFVNSDQKAAQDLIMGIMYAISDAELQYKNLINNISKTKVEKALKD